jgi:hypothetical protein
VQAVYPIFVPPASASISLGNPVPHPPTRGPVDAIPLVLGFRPGVVGTAKFGCVAVAVTVALCTPFFIQPRVELLPVCTNEWNLSDFLGFGYPGADGRDEVRPEK